MTRVNLGDDGSFTENCYVSGSVRGGTFTAGFVGMLSFASTVKNSYTTASVFSTGTYASGFVASQTQGSIVTGCVSLGDTIRSTTNVYRISNAAIVTIDGETVQQLKNNYALSTTVLMVGTTEISLTRTGMDSVNGFSMTLAELQTQATYATPPLSWDFTKIWAMNPNGNKLPIFMYQKEEDTTITSIRNPLPIVLRPEIWFILILPKDRLLLRLRMQPSNKF
jgi:hypothetical protein